MKLITQFKKDFRYFRASIVYFIFSFMIAPIVLGLLYGALYQKMVSPDIELDPINIYIEESIDDIYMPVVKQLLNNNYLDFINTQNVLDNELENKLKENDKSLGIKEENKVIKIINYGPNSTEKNIVTSLISPVINAISHKNIEKMNDKELNKVVEEYLQLKTKDFTELNEIDTNRKFNSYQLMVVGVFTAMSFFIAVTFASNFLKEREDSVLRRLFSFDITEKSIYFNTTVSVFIISLLLIISYSFIAYRLVLKMEFSIIKMIIMNIIQAGFIASLYGLFIGLFRKEKIFKNLITPIIMVIMVLGGSYFPVDMFKNLAKFTKYMPNYNLLKIYENVLLGQSIKELTYPISFLLGATVLLIITGMAKFLVKEEK